MLTPIIWGHDLKSRPIGVMKMVEGRIMFVLRESANIKVEDINTIALAFAPQYMISKEKNGIVLEIELFAISLLNKHP